VPKGWNIKAFVPREREPGQRSRAEKIGMCSKGENKGMSA
jgi:hypothetical protein